MLIYLVLLPLLRSKYPVLYEQIGTESSSTHVDDQTGRSSFFGFLLKTLSRVILLIAWFRGSLYMSNS